MASLFNEKSPFGAGRASNYTLPSVSLEPTNIRFAAQSTEELFDEGDGMPTPVVAPPPRSGNNLNTLQGVFVPTILNIFGVVTFLRMGWMTGECGLLITLGIIFVGELTVTLTALSISAIATNGTMRGGGAYYLISRSLGPEFGGAIGAIFYTANVFGSATFLKGFVEATNDLNILPIGYWWGFLYATVVLIVLTITAGVGARFFIRVLAFIFVLEMGSLLFALISFMFQSPGVTEGYTGWSWSTFTDNLMPHFTNNNTVQSVFAVFFPAIAGIMGGTNMSGDLARPSYSIPRGTLIAIATATTLYLALILTMAFTTTYSTLQDYNVFQRVSFASPIITIGVYSAALSSTLGSMGGGSRILQALARDNLLWFLKPFGAGFGTGDEPVIAILLTYVLVQAALFLPELNTVATISSLFFLFSYGIVNTACFAMCISSTPSFRPTFRFYSTYTAFGGVFLCVFACFMINFYIATATIAILGALVIYIHTTARETNWGDVSQAILFHQVRKFLLRLDVRKEHIKHWRPSLLLFAKNPTDIRSIVLGNHIKKGGLYLIGHVLLGSLEEQGTQSQEARNAWLRLIHLLKVKGFPQLVLTPSFRLGLQNLLLSGGLGVMRPNTVMLTFHTRDVPELTIEEESDGTLSSFRANGRRASASPLSVRPVRQPPKATTDAIKRIFTHHTPPPKLTDAEYVNAIKDILFFKCHAIICRNEELLDFDAIREFRCGTGSRLSRVWQYYRSNKRMNIDVWAIPLNSREKFRSPVLTFTLLMAWILQRTDEWQHYTRVRILSVAPDPLQIGGVMEKVKNLTTFCRISADIQVVSLNMTEAHEPFGWDIPVVERFRMFNETIANHSQDTAITFLPLLHPPQETEGYDEYLQALDALTVGLPPVLMCRAISPVITTDL